MYRLSGKVEVEKVSSSFRNGECCHHGAVALRGFLGPGCLTMDGAGKQCARYPQLLRSHVEQRITGIGALQRFLDLFPRICGGGTSPQGDRSARLDGTRKICGGVCVAQDLLISSVHHQTKAGTHTSQVTDMGARLQTSCAPTPLAAPATPSASQVRRAVGHSVLPSCAVKAHGRLCGACRGGTRTRPTPASWCA